MIIDEKIDKEILNLELNDRIKIEEQMYKNLEDKKWLQNNNIGNVKGIEIQKIRRITYLQMNGEIKKY